MVTGDDFDTKPQVSGVHSVRTRDREPRSHSGRHCSTELAPSFGELIYKVRMRASAVVASAQKWSRIWSAMYLAVSRLRRLISSSWPSRGVAWTLLSWSR